jgi:hypothetical protein
VEACSMYPTIAFAPHKPACVTFQLASEGFNVT